MGPVDQMQAQFSKFPGRSVVAEAGPDEQTVDRIRVCRLVTVPVPQGQIHHDADDIAGEFRTLGIGNVHQGDQDAECDPRLFLFHLRRVEQLGRFASPEPEPRTENLCCDRGRTRSPGQCHANEL